MSYPYPQDRHRDRREKNDQQYQEAVEEYSEQQAELERKASVPHEKPQPESTEVQEQEAEDRFEEIGEDVREQRETS